MNPHPKWLREAAKHMFADGHVAWGNTCERAADDLEAVQAHRDRLLESHLKSQADGGQT